MKAQDPVSWAEACAFDEAIREVSSRDQMRERQFVHRQRVPLADADLGDDTEDMFAHECQGMCGV